MTLRPLDIVRHSNGSIGICTVVLANGDASVSWLWPDKQPLHSAWWPDGSLVSIGNIPSIVTQEMRSHCTGTVNPYAPTP